MFEFNLHRLGLVGHAESGWPCSGTSYLNGKWIFVISALSVSIFILSSEGGAIESGRTPVIFFSNVGLLLMTCCCLVIVSEIKFVSPSYSIYGCAWYMVHVLLFFGA